MKIYNTLTGKKQDFVPLDGNKVKMYACGITVSGEAHIGHLVQQLEFLHNGLADAAGGELVITAGMHQFFHLGHDGIDLGHADGALLTGALDTDGELMTVKELP